MNNKEENIVLTALEQLHQTTGAAARLNQIEGDKFMDGTIDIFLKNKETRFFIETKRELRAHHLPAIMEAAVKYQPLLVIAETIFPKLKEELRKQNIAYLDAAGNAYINHGELVIWIDGRKNEATANKIINRAFTKAGLKVVFHLLVNDDAINAPYRELAKKAEVGLGNINYVIAGLKDMGFILQLDDRRKKLQNKKELFDRWVNGFTEILKPALHVGNFRFANTADFVNWRQLQLKQPENFWGEEPAADILTNNLNPANLTIYTQLNKADIMRQLKVIPDAGGNVKVYNKFWEAPAGDALPTAPPLLVYTDLLLTGDPRCQEIAGQIFDQYLANEFK